MNVFIHVKVDCSEILCVQYEITDFWCQPLPPPPQLSDFCQSRANFELTLWNVNLAPPREILLRDFFKLCETIIGHLANLVGSMDQESSQQLQMWFSEHFFAPKRAT